jgi:hypothetical protein
MGHNTKIDKVPFPLIDINAINTVGVETTYTSPTGSVGRFQGFLGAVIYLDNADAYMASDRTNVGTLYHGRYQLVQLVSTSQAAGVRGYAAFWPAASLSALAQATRYQVTADATDGDHAGVFIGALTQGYYGWIQLDGLCTVQYKATLTAATPAIKDRIYVTSGAATFDDPQYSPTTDSELKRFFGMAEAVPVGAALNLVEVFPRIENW